MHVCPRQGLASLQTSKRAPVAVRRRHPPRRMGLPGTSSPSVGLEMVVCMRVLLVPCATPVIRHTPARSNATASSSVKSRQPKHMEGTPTWHI